MATNSFITTSCSLAIGDGESEWLRPVFTTEDRPAHGAFGSDRLEDHQQNENIKTRRFFPKSHLPTFLGPALGSISSRFAGGALP